MSDEGSHWNYISHFNKMKMWMNCHQSICPIFDFTSFALCRISSYLRYSMAVSFVGFCCTYDKWNSGLKVSQVRVSTTECEWGKNEEMSLYNNLLHSQAL